MKKICVLLLCYYMPQFAKSQKVGIGTPSPEMALQVQAADSAVLLLNNSTTMDVNTNVGLYFKNGLWYSGALRTIGSGSNAARLGLFTYATTSVSDLRERLSITDNGYVGINNTQPEAFLHLDGTQIIRNNSPYSSSALDVSTTLSTVSIPAIRSYSSGSGIFSGTGNPAGTGLLAWNAPTQPPFQPGTALTAYSTQGHGLFAQSTNVGSISLRGVSQNSNIIAAKFENTAGGKALVTNGTIQIEGQGAGAGKVLTSDAAGNATWQTPGSTIAFRGYLNSSFLLSPNSTFPVSGITTFANDGNAFNGNSGEFVAPVAGWYQFTVNTQFISPASDMRMTLDFLYNGSVTLGGTFVFLINPTTGTQFDSRSITQTFKLGAGDRIAFQYRHTWGTGTINLFGGSSTTTTMFYGSKM